MFPDDLDMSTARVSAVGTERHATGAPRAEAVIDRQLAVTLHGRTTSYPLPECGALSIGRSRSNHVCLPDSLISRHHAVLHLGRIIEIEDLGSQNGVTMRMTARSRYDSSAGETAVERTLVARTRTRVPRGAVLYLGNAALVIEDVQPEDRPDDDVVIVDDEMRRLFAMVERLAPSEISVLLLGESGVGKEVFAQRIHERSPRRGQPFMSINCGALTATLLESELFGYEKGAFTGATRTKPGLLEAADGGVVLLDEVGELPPELQVKLLRVLEERKVLRLGSVTPRSIDVRFVSATNRDLKREVEAGRFRRDLYYRLHGIALTIPPLRERPSEILALAAAFLRQLAAGSGHGGPPELSERARQALLNYGWPGNIRELRNVVERAVIMSRGRGIEPEHLGLGASGARRAITAPPVPAGSRSCPDTLRQRAENAERDRVLAALDACAGNQTRAAAMLGLTRRALIGRIEKYGIPRPRKSRRAKTRGGRASTATDRAVTELGGAE